MRHFALPLLVVLAGGCGSEAGPAPRGPEAKPASTQQAEASGTSTGIAKSGLTVGAPCTYKDGYVPAFPQCDPTDANGNPVNCPPTSSQPVTEYHQLPPGIGYCLTGDVFPHGYFTMNCAADSDCPAGNRCDGVCRKPCLADNECLAPTACLQLPNNAPVRSVRYCACVDCTPRDPL